MTSSTSPPVAGAAHHAVAPAVHPTARPADTRAGNPPRTVGVLAPFLGGFYFGGVVSGATRAAAGTGHPVLAVQTFPAGLDRGEDPEQPPHDLQVAATQAHALRLATRSMTGIVVVSNALPVTGLERLYRLGKPLVLVSAVPADWPVPMVGPDNVAGVRAVVDHLVGHGHRRIGFVGHLGPARHGRTAPRLPAGAARARHHAAPARGCCARPTPWRRAAAMPAGSW